MDERKQLLDSQESNVETLFNQTDLNLQQVQSIYPTHVLET